MFPYVLLAGVLAQACGAAPSSAPHAMLGRPFSMALPSNAGALVTLPTPGRPAVLDFFGPTCEPCRTAVPALWARREEIGRSRGRIILIAVLAPGQTTDDARRVLDEWGLSGVPFLVDREDVSARQAGVKSLPATLVVDATGVIRWAAPAGAGPDSVVQAAAAWR